MDDMKQTLAEGKAYGRVDVRQQFTMLLAYLGNLVATRQCDVINIKFDALPDTVRRFDISPTGDVSCTRPGDSAGWCKLIMATDLHNQGCMTTHLYGPVDVLCGGTLALPPTSDAARHHYKRGPAITLVGSVGYVRTHHASSVVNDHDLVEVLLPFWLASANVTQQDLVARNQQQRDPDALPHVWVRMHHEHFDYDARALYPLDLMAHDMPDPKNPLGARLCATVPIGAMWARWLTRPIIAQYAAQSSLPPPHHQQQQQQQ